jgi:putative membrane protein
MMGGLGFPLMGFGLGSLLVIGLVIAGIVWLIQSSNRGSTQSISQTPYSEAPIEILKRRYAAGEVTKEQFDLMKRDLE